MKQQHMIIIIIKQKWHSLQTLDPNTVNQEKYDTTRTAAFATKPIEIFETFRFLLQALVAFGCTFLCQWA
mgnify:CR=1 FL=1